MTPSDKIIDLGKRLCMKHGVLLEMKDRINLVPLRVRYKSKFIVELDSQDFKWNFEITKGEKFHKERFYLDMSFIISSLKVINDRGDHYSKNNITRTEIKELEQIHNRINE